MAIRTANRDCAHLIESGTSFQGSNLRGEYSNNALKVYSYWTLMARIDYDTKEIWLNESKYSQTTSKQMRYVRNGIAKLVAKGYTLTV